MLHMLTVVAKLVGYGKMRKVVSLAGNPHNYCREKKLH